jgi:excisionase family DNA binding protein
MVQRIHSVPEPTPDPVELVRAIALQLADALVAVASSQTGPAQPDDLYSLEEAARLLRISPSGLKRARQRGEIRTIRVGRRQLISSSELRRVQRERER